MFDSETRHFIRCDTCPDDNIVCTPKMAEKDAAVAWARRDHWEIRDDLHRCWLCVRDGRTEMAS